MKLLTCPVCGVATLPLGPLEIALIEVGLCKRCFDWAIAILTADAYRSGH
jgi:hypothetical protein